VARSQRNGPFYEGTTPLKLIKYPNSTSETSDMRYLKYFRAQISNCGKWAFVESHGRVQKIYGELVDQFSNLKKYPNQVTMSVESSGKLTRRWVPWSAEAFTRRVYALTGSGLASLWEKWIDRVTTWNTTVMLGKRLHDHKVSGCP